MAIVVLATTSSEGSDRANLSLPEVQLSMLNAVLDTQPNTVVVVLSPGAVLLPFASRAAATLLMFMPGTRLGQGWTLGLVDKISLQCRGQWTVGNGCCVGVEETRSKRIFLLLPVFCGGRASMVFALLLLVFPPGGVETCRRYRRGCAWRRMPLSSGYSVCAHCPLVIGNLLIHSAVVHPMQVLGQVMHSPTCCSGP